MAQNSIVLDANVSGLAYTVDVNAALAAVDSAHSGSSAPTDEVVNGKLWLDTSTTPHTLKIYHSGSWRSLFGLSGSVTEVRGTAGVISGTLTASDVNTTSDARLKTRIETISNALEKVKEMRGVTFDKEGAPSSGVIAQEIEKIAPEAVKEINDIKTVSYANLIGYLIEAIKDQSDLIQKLEERINDLSTR